MAKSTVSLRRCFAELDEPRREHQRLHNLWDIIALTICAVVSGADSWVEVEKYGHSKHDWLQAYLDLPNGIPSHDTIRRVFALINPVSFQQGFSNWIAELADATEGRLIAIDGKTLRRSFDPANGKNALHLVSAWASENRLLLGQQAVDGKSNEITAIPKLLEVLDLTGAIVTIDAMGCQKEIAQQIEVCNGDYVLSLKENHETLYNDVRDLFLEGLETDFANLEHHSCHTEDEGHGRHETRYYHVMPIPKELAEKHDGWVGLRTLGMVFCERQVGDAAPTTETRFYISSLAPKVKTFARAVRGHWGIENSLHWVLDVSFREDESRLRVGHGPENLALLRRMAASILQNEKTKKIGVAAKRKLAGWDDKYLHKVLGAKLR